MSQNWSGSGNESIAVIGIGCRFPGGADDPEAYWELLRNGVDAITEVPADRWDLQTYYNPDQSTPGKMYTRWGGFLKGIDQFDALFFGISPREAARMDPQQRLLLEVSWEALEDAWQIPQKLAGSSTGVFIGISGHDYGDIQQKDRYGTDPYAISGGAASIAANRISYLLDFRGPSIAVDTACSSSLVAVHLACQSLLQGESTLALAGGVNLIINPEPTIGFCRAAMLSPDGRCKAFDARANGYVRSEGAGAILLKPLSDALADGDRIYAVIKGTGVNQDGRTVGMTVPSGPAQERLLWDVYRQAKVEPGKVQYVEAHGTGTAVGDPIEANALGKVLSSQRPSGSRCAIGSVKTNIGHLEAASGIAGLIKVALAINNREIPASLHFDEPNPDIGWDEYQMRVPKTTEPWSDDPIIAGVNSFGFGGTNAHIVLQEAPHAPVAVPREEERISGRAFLLPISARTLQAVEDSAKAYSTFLKKNGHESLHDMCYTASLHRAHHDQRLAMVIHSPEELTEYADVLVSGETRPGMSSGRQTPGSHPKLVFVCSGMGPQWWAMGRQLLEEEPLFRKTIERCDELLSKHASWSLLDELLADESSSRMADAEIAQPANFAIQVALAALWDSWGVRPDAVVGHSAGEIAAAYISGALSLEDAVTVIFHRSRLQQLTTGKGKMAAVGLSAGDAERVLQGYEDRLSIGAINGATTVTLTGDADALEEVANALQEQQVFCRILTVDVPYHSHHMDPLQAELVEVLHGLDPQSATTPIVSTVTGDFIDGREFDASYWWRNVREPVAFSDSVDNLIEGGYSLFVELSPHPVLAGSITQILARRNQSGHVVPSLRRNDEERATMLASLGSLFVNGYSVDWSKLYSDGGSRLRLPSYPWQRERHWHELEALASDRIGRYVHPLLGRRLQAPKPTWEVELDRHRLAYLNDHSVQASAVYPAAAYIEMALAAAKQMFGEGNYVLQDIEFKRALFLLDQTTPTLRLSFDPLDGSFDIYSRTSDTSEEWTFHSTGKIGQHQANSSSMSVTLDEIKSRCTKELSAEDSYVEFAARGLRYGPSFQGIVQLWQGDDEALGEIRIPDLVAQDESDYQFHPSILDSCFQVLMGTVTSDSANGDPRGMYIPVQIDRIRVYSRPGPRIWSYARISERAGNLATGEIVIFNERGDIVAEVQGLRSQYIEGAHATRLEELDRYLYEFQWFPRSLAGHNNGCDPASFIPSPAQIADSVKSDAEEINAKGGLEPYYQGLKSQIDYQCAAYYLDAFQQMGWTLSISDKVTTDSLIKQLNVAPEYHRLVGRLLAMLQEDGILREVGSEWEVCRIPEATDTQEAMSALIDKYPAFNAELDMLERCGPYLAEVLHGEVDPLDLLFPAGSLALGERVYQSSPSYLVYNLMVQRAVSSALEELPKGQTVRILEIGGGSGGLTVHVLPELPQNRTEYVFTDISNVFTMAAESKFLDYPFVRYQLLDIEVDPEEQGFEPHSFDVILASDVLHATKDLRKTLQNVKQLLAPEGLLVLLELQKTPRWIELAAGLLKGWWLFEDFDLRPSHPMLSRHQWRELLGDMGFGEAAAITDIEQEDEAVHSVILARGPKVQRVTSPQLKLPDKPEQHGSWLIFSDSGGMGRDLANRLESQGENPILMSPGEFFQAIDDHHFQVRTESGADTDIGRVLEEVASSHLPFRGVVHLWSLDAPCSESATTGQLKDAQDLGCVSAMHLIKALAETNLLGTPRLWLITQGGQSVDPKLETLSVAQSPMWGLGRVIINEHPELRCTMVDVDPEDSPESVESLFEELWSEYLDEEIAYRGGQRYVRRLVEVSPDAYLEAEHNKLGTDESQSFHLEIKSPGVLDSLILRESSRRKPGAGEVEIQVYTAGLNFMDVLAASGVLPTEHSYDVQPPLGQECAGKIVAVGGGVEDFQLGDDVVALSPGSFSAHVTVPATYVVHKPAHLSFEEAATIPIVFMTTYYALHHLSRLAAGERILIHSAAGGIGLAAVQLAQLAGAEIFATAGSPEKRDFLGSLGVKRVMDSRSLDFADEIMEHTEGKGVDVVLNSLAGDFIPKSFSVLGPYGRFLEIGKRDIYENNKLGLQPFRRNLSFFAIDLARIVIERPEMAGALLREVMQKFEEKTLHPIPHKTFAISKSVDAFRYMVQARHIGKIVISLQDKDAMVVPSFDERRTIRSDCTYLITGGLGGFGLTVAQWMVERGAKNLVLASRNGISSVDAQNAVDELRNAGARVEIMKADVSREEQVASVLERISHSMPPLRGIVHAAMVLDDGLLLQLDRDRFRTVMAPKMDGAWNLHVQTLGTQLDFFVLFSSFASMIGNTGQGNYVAANLFLDSLTHYRRSKNLPALTVNWGLLAGVGYVARHGDINRYLETIGFEPFQPEQATALLQQFIERDMAQVGAFNLDWQQAVKAWPQAATSPRFSHLVRKKARDQQKDGKSIRSALVDAAPEERKEALENFLREQIARVLGTSSSRLDYAQPLTNLGLDSLMVVELTTLIDVEIGSLFEAEPASNGINPGATANPGFQLMEDTTVTQLAANIMDQLSGAFRDGVAAD